MRCYPVRLPVDACTLCSMNLATVTMGDLARRSGLYDIVEPTYSSRKRRQWESGGRQIPAPSAVKREIIREHGTKHRLRTLVETGTYKADTVRALRNDFDVIHSIEIAPNFHRRAAHRCRNQANARLHLGDSADVMPKILADLNGPALFWLDAHHSGGETGGAGDHPTVAELRSILSDSRDHVLLIDDVREFGVDADYPPLSAIEDTAHEYGYTFDVEYDVARLRSNKSVS